MAKSFQPPRRRRRSAQFRTSLRLSLFLGGLMAINVYVFFFRNGTSISTVMQPSVTGQTLDEAKMPPREESLAGPLVVTRQKATLKIGQNGQALTASPVKDQVIGAQLNPGPNSGGNGLRVVEGKVGPKDTLGSVLAREGFGESAGNVIRALGRLVDPKTIQAGDSYIASFDESGGIAGFEYLPEPATRYIVTAEGEAGQVVWKGRKESKPLETRTVDATGVVVSSLYDSIHKAGEASALVSALVEIFAWDINFYVDTHPGDRWRVVIEKQFLGGAFYKYGNLVAAEYFGRAGSFRAFYYTPAPGRVAGRYFDEKGQAIAKTMLKTPLRFVRISSKFDRKRFHPILHRTKAHLGVDYAAPVGTPIWASASGKVVECGMKPGSGNTVVINHGGGLASRYYHLSRFAPGMRAGRPIKQKEVIGYVGTTGLSTGPHLHFSVTKFGAFVDPSSLPVSREAPVPDKSAFLAAIRPHLQAMKAAAGQVPVAKK